MKKIGTRIISMMVIFALCICTASSVFAVEVTDEASTEKQVVAVTVEVVDDTDATASPRSYDQVLSFTQKDFSYDGSCSCVLGPNYSDIGIKAGISSSSAVGNVRCFVKLPNGSIYTLGTVPASGGTTAISNFPTASSGTYTFYFESSTSVTLNGFGYIYKR